jgi:hypothetical protein
MALEFSNVGAETNDLLESGSSKDKGKRNSLRPWITFGIGSSAPFASTDSNRTIRGFSCGDVTK